MNVLDLYQQLEKTGLLKVDPRPSDEPPNVPSIPHPLPLIPEIRLNVKELKKWAIIGTYYCVLVFPYFKNSLLHSYDSIPFV